MTININRIISITATLIILNSITFWSFLSHQMMLITFCKVSKNNDLHHDIDHLQNNADHHTCKVRAIIAAAIGALALVPVCFVVHLGQSWCYYAWGCSHINQSPITNHHPHPSHLLIRHTYDEGLWLRFAVHWWFLSYRWSRLSPNTALSTWPRNRPWRWSKPFGDHHEK